MNRRRILAATAALAIAGVTVVSFSAIFQGAAYCAGSSACDETDCENNLHRRVNDSWRRTHRISDISVRAARYGISLLPPTLNSIWSSREKPLFLGSRAAVLASGRLRLGENEWFRWMAGVGSST